MKDNFISEMNTFFNESPKCHLYRYIFDNNVLQFYLDRPLNYIYKPYGIFVKCVYQHIILKLKLEDSII